MLVFRTKTDNGKSAEKDGKYKVVRWWWCCSFVIWDELAEKTWSSNVYNALGEQFRCGYSQSAGIGPKLLRNWYKIAQELVTNCSGNAELGKNCQELLLDITLSFKMLIKLLPSLKQDTRRASWIRRMIAMGGPRLVSLWQNLVSRK